MSTTTDDPEVPAVESGGDGAGADPAASAATGSGDAEARASSTSAEATDERLRHERTKDMLHGVGRVALNTLITIVIGIASAMLLSIVRRRGEIGIMRAVGASQRFVLGVFVIEGTLIGTAGAVAGAALAWLALAPFPPVAEVEGGGLPVDRAQGDFLLAIALTAVAAAFASLLAARRATQIDPVEAIGT